MKPALTFPIDNHFAQWTSPKELQVLAGCRSCGRKFTSPLAGSPCSPPPRGLRELGVPALSHRLEFFPLIVMLAGQVLRLAQVRRRDRTLEFQGSCPLFRTGSQRLPMQYRY